MFSASFLLVVHVVSLSSSPHDSISQLEYTDEEPVEIEEGLSLLQIAAEALEASDPSAATTSLDAPPAHAAFKSGIEALQRRVASVEAASDETLANLIKRYTQQLEEQSAQREEVGSVNARLEAEIASLEEKRSELTTLAASISAENKRTEEEIRAFMANLSLVQEFSQQFLNLSNDNASETAVVRELEAQREEEEKDKLRASRLDEIATSTPRSGAAVSLLAVGEQVRQHSGHGLNGPATTPSKILEDVEGSLKMLKEQEKQRVASVSKDFKAKLAHGTAEQAELLKHQAALNQTKDELANTTKRLQAAVLHLSGLRSRLQGGLKALHSFTQQLALPKSTDNEEPDTGLTNQDARPTGAGFPGAEPQKNDSAAEKKHKSRLTIDGRVVPKPESWVSWLAETVSRTKHKRTMSLLQAHNLLFATPPAREPATPNSK